MDSLNLAITSLFDLYFNLFQEVSPWIGLSFISLVTGIILLIVFRFTSNQAAIGKTKERIRGHFLEIRLFQDDPVIVIGSLGRIMKDNFIYLRYTMVPFLFMLVPVVLMLVQMDMRYGSRPFTAGDETVLRVETAKGSRENLEKLKIDVPDFVRVNVRPVRIPSTGEVLWGLKITGEGRGDISISAKGSAQKLSIVSGGGVPRIVGTRTNGGFWNRLLNPGSKTLRGDSGLKLIEIKYPAREMKIGNRTVHWLIIYFAISVVFGYSVKGLFGVEV